MVTARRNRTRALTLWMNGAFVGTWQLGHGGDVLQYDEQWTRSGLGRPLSLSLPFRPGNPPHTGDVVRHYFDNLLPDSREIRERIARRYQAADTDAFGLLAEVGRDCVGALQILPADTANAPQLPVEAIHLTEQEIAELLRETLMPAPLGLPEAEDFRISIAGAQEKTALLKYLDRWCMPHGPTPTTHIFKLPLGAIGGLKLDMRDSVENEWLCAKILAAYGMPVAPCDILTFEDQKVLAVERFDRQWWMDPATGQWNLLRLPQEDMCQATGTPPWQKYESDHGPGMKEIMELLSGAIDPVTARRTFFKAQVLFWMLWATDGHAKNFSIFLKPDGKYELTPLYDVLSVFPIIGEGPGKLSEHKAAMAMAVRSKNPHRKMREIQPRHWHGVGMHYGIVTEDGDGPNAILKELADKTPDVISGVRKELPADFPEYVADSILNGLNDSADKLAAYLRLMATAEN
ncbi:type II toxin-antitoxin system HipA family toxin [Herbaspirillum sp. SJZ099]|uniref:type II toxin-antitoxin system HipA family toxin n=1 Tax=Herbaspirillum sp. SJZ099 TaxID=2572916 RepID=UPI0011AE15BF|nr:type II toxin-antitoxin system HipA family toxin [Herbaspirillum sp. SJZ099]TWC65099.1 serine/threonine-protein kinase HipA [Herbaspirillum sp. SJZ099]